MDFTHGVKFDLTIATGDSFAAATISSLLTAAVMMRKMTGSDTEKAALNATYRVERREPDDSLCQFGLGVRSLLQSPLFQSMVH